MFTQNELILMIGVVSILLLLIIILTIFDIKDGLAKRKIKVVNNDSSEEDNVIEDKIDTVEVFEVDDENLIQDFNKEENTIMEEVHDEDIFLEEEPLSVQVNEVKPVNVNLDEEFNKAIDEVPLESAISKFEDEQERTAIISLDELMKKTNELYDSNEYVQYDDGDEPITIDEVIARYNQIEERNNNIKEEKPLPKVVEEVVEEKRIPYSKKETIPFISSVYGIEKDNGLTFENTATYEKLNKENNDFIAKLREIRENK